ncbi:RNA methyltransferase [Cytophaga sp. FL35]|uniref:TrmH family RNA methyltransferase n=1 Tax=Cytophaga sp. FL35 TaxID=1904456 RepID=UPI0016534AA1|nr:RNA methyltransferase [Cytophaga sp. FL35]MBC6998655.1 RNA methyltransferase [Cytophaga sp. FL35]
MDQKQLLEFLEGFISEERKQRFIDILQDRTKLITVAMEDVYQLHNTSAVIRSCDIFGVQEAHVIENRFGKRLDKKIAMGAQKWVDVHRYKTTTECIDSLKTRGYKVIATSPHYDSCDLNDFEITEKTAFFFGTEREGLTDEVLEKSDGFLKIPMLGFTESLNISVAVAIILHQLSAQLRTTNLDWKLTEEEILDKRIDWTKKSIKSIDSIMGRVQKEGLREL